VAAGVLLGEGDPEADVAPSCGDAVGSLPARAVAAPPVGVAEGTVGEVPVTEVPVDAEPVDGVGLDPGGSGVSTCPGRAPAAPG
jgi:hypothetical protein